MTEEGYVLHNRDTFQGLLSRHGVEGISIPGDKDCGCYISYSLDLMLGLKEVHDW